MSTVPWLIRRWKDGFFEDIEDEVVREVPLTLFLNERELVTLLTLGEHTEELAVGFLRSERLLRSRDDLLDVRLEEGRAHVRTRSDTGFVEKLLEKRTVTTGCGKGSTFYHPLDALTLEPFSAEPPEPLFSPEAILGRMKDLEARSGVYERTGGTHNASLADPARTLLFRTDIGRHNAVDMLIGECFLGRLTTHDKILLTTGRITSEILIKAAKVGIPVIVSRSSPTGMAIRLARELNLTVIGRVRSGSMVLYSGAENVLPD